MYKEALYQRGADEDEVKAGKSKPLGRQADSVVEGESDRPTAFDVQFEPVHVDRRCDGSKCEDGPIEDQKKEGKLTIL